MDSTGNYLRWADQYIAQIRDMQAIIDRQRIIIDEFRLDESKKIGDVVDKLIRDKQLLQEEVRRLESRIAHMSKQLTQFHGPYRK